MPEHASRFAGLYDQHNENRIPDWGGDELFTRMPSPPAVDDAPPPRFRPSLMLVDAPAERGRPPLGDEWRGVRDRRPTPSGEESMRRRAERLGISVVEDRRAEPVESTVASRERTPDSGTVHPWDGVPAAPAAEARAESPSRTDLSAPSPSPIHAQDESPATAAARAWEATHSPDARGAIEPTPERAPNGRRTTVITGRPDGSPRPLSLVPAQRRRPTRTPAEWIGPRPERIVAWAFALGLLLILLAISTADAATL